MFLTSSTTISYVLHVLRHTRNRNLVVIDNDEWLYAGVIQ